MSAILWEPIFCPCDDYQWATGDIGNGWSASVSDHSQSCAPRKATKYVAAAICRWWLVSYPAEFENFADAKKAAIDLALAQKTACPDASCRVEYLRESDR